MNYALVWQPPAENQLLALFIRAADKDALTATVARIDEILARDPLAQGESREGNRRLWFYRPLSVNYVTIAASRTVFVVSVKWVGR